MFKTLLIDGMYCSHCAGIINIELFKIKEILDVKVDIANKRAIVRLSDAIPNDRFRTAIETAGYTLTNVI